jgi:hypothetical protein
MVRTDFTTNSYRQHFPKALYLVETHFLIMGVKLTPRLLFSVTTSAKRILNVVILVPMLSWQWKQTPLIILKRHT